MNLRTKWGGRIGGGGGKGKIMQLHFNFKRKFQKCVINYYFDLKILKVN